ncbi:MAG: endonuclease domain-containing protein [Oscillospiraceae bacterium]|nr:endonuclease domain-containing protein [Oscillospiraceae bacterium]
MISKNGKLLPNAKALRRDMTPHERKLWYLFLRNYPVKIYKQRIIESYIVDFYCASAKLVIEIDGSQHFEDDGKAKDIKRDQKMNSLGLMVLRFDNHQIDWEFQAVCDRINHVIQERQAQR